MLSRGVLSFLNRGSYQPKLSCERKPTCMRDALPSDFSCLFSVQIKAHTRYCTSGARYAVADGFAATDATLGTAVAAWLADPAAAELEYGHISVWDTSYVTDMLALFCAHSVYCPDTNFPGAASFNGDWLFCCEFGLRSFC